MCHLMKKGRKYQDFILGIEAAEVEREDALVLIERLEQRRSQGRISREAFMKVRREYEKRLRKATNTIDRTLIEMRSLLTA